MNTNQLAVALRAKASEVRGLNTEYVEEVAILRDAISLLRVLANVVEGEPIHKAFGLPGDWGYDTAIGRALFAAPEVPNV